MLPFYYTPLRVPTNCDLPDSLPFALDIDEETGTLVQMPNETISDALSRAYLKGSVISGAMDTDLIGSQYAQDFLSFLKRSLLRNRLEGARVLEVGCGTGYLLNRLKRLGADVLGLEPGPQGQHGSERFHIPIIRDFFPSSKIYGEFDLILLNQVLEHVQAPSDFLSSARTHLKKEGRVAVSVPDCEPYLRVGDISILFCQHWNYYNERTLRNCVGRYLGFQVHIERASFGGALYAITEQAMELNACPVHPESELRMAVNFRQLAEKGIASFLEYLEATTGKGESLGIYVPGRAINALSMLRQRVDLSRVRFFDDNKLLQSTYFPGFDTAIEGIETLIERPPDRVLVMSRSFGREIARKLISSIGRRLPITTWQDLFENPAQTPNEQ